MLHIRKKKKTSLEKKIAIMSIYLQYIKESTKYPMSVFKF